MSLSAVARAAGVSVSTVSRYAKGQLQLKPETEDHIRVAMREVGYDLPQLETIESRVVLIVPDLSNPYFADVAGAVARACSERGLEALVSVTGGIAHRERQLVASCAAMDDLYGILYIGMNRTNAELSAVAERKPVVVLDEPMDRSNSARIPLVKADNFGGAFQATNYLIQQGHRTIAHVGGPDDLESAHERLRGYREALDFHRLPHHEELTFRGPYSEKYGTSVLTYVLRAAPRPTALMVSSDIVAIGIISAAEQHGLEIPHDLSLVGFDGIAVGAWLRPKLTTVVQPVEDLVTTGLQELRRLHEGDAGQDHSLPMELRIRESSAALAPVV